MASVVRVAMIFHYPTSLANVCVMTANVLDAGASPTSDAEVDTIIATFKDWWDVGVGGEGALKARAMSSCVLKEVQAQRFMSPPPSLMRSASYNIAGTINGFGAPPTIAAVISLRTGLAGKSYRGRMYMPGMEADSDAQNGALSSAKQQGIADSAKGLIAGIPTLVGEDFKLGVWSRKLQVGNDVTQVRVGNKLDVQRRRRIGGESYVIGT